MKKLEDVRQGRVVGDSLHFLLSLGVFPRGVIVRLSTAVGGKNRHF